MIEANHMLQRGFIHPPRCHLNHNYYILPLFLIKKIFYDFSPLQHPHTDRKLQFTL